MDEKDERDTLAVMGCASLLKGFILMDYTEIYAGLESLFEMAATFAPDPLEIQNWYDMIPYI